MERFGQYILLDKVGSGGMAELFKAKKIGIEGFERVLAIKRILPHLSSDEEFIDMFIAEAKLVARLSHKNITQVYDFGKIGQNYFIAMEYIRGKDLRGILKRCRERNIKFPVALAVFIAKEVASALGYAHRQKDSSGKNLNIIHRDVSPQNILIAYEGDAKVVDFGIAKAGAHSKTSTGVLKGKLSYMSPEQAWGKPIDHRSDIFALGIVLYELLTGERLFKGDSEINTLEKVREAKVEPLPSVINADMPPELEAKLLKALAREVTERYQNASEMEADLGEILFELLHVDPAISLKKFMHDLFRAEIESEHKSELVEDTVSIPLEQEPLAAQVMNKKVATVRTPQPQRIKAAPARKRKLYPYVIAAVAACLIIAAFIFLPGRTDMSFYLNRLQNLSTKNLKFMEKKTDIPSSAEVVTITMKNGNVLSWSSYFEEDNSYCTYKSSGKFCVQKSDVAEIKEISETGQPVARRVSETAKTGILSESTAVTTTSAADEQKAQTPPEPKQAAEATEGRLTVNAVPWANVFVNGKDYGTTPKTIEALKAGTYKVRLENPNFPAWETKVNVSKGETAKVAYKFGGFGKLVVNATPWGNVYLDGNPKGQTPLTIEKVPSGRHQIKITRDSFSDVSKTIEMRENSTEQVSVSLKKEDE